jgi:hypothetical protein
LRPLLIEDNVHFEQTFFMKKIALGRVDIAGAHAWFRQASSLPDNLPTDGNAHSQGNTWDFIRALVNLTLPSKSSEMVPHTFLFDEERTIKLRSDMLDLINLEICMYQYRNLDAQCRLQESLYSVSDDTPTTSSMVTSRPALPPDGLMLSSATLPEPESLYQSAANSDPRQRLLSDPNLAYRSSVPGKCSSFGGLLSYILRHPNCILLPLLGLIPYASASPIGSTTPKGFNSELWYILQTFFQDNWDHLIGLPLLFFMLKFLDKGLFRNEDRSTPSAFTMVSIATGLVYAGNAQDFEVSHVTLWSLLCVRVVIYYIGPTLRNLSLGRL